MSKLGERTYGLIGYPLIHSFSRTYFNQKFEAENINARYENFEIPSIDVLPSLLESHPAISGMNVTIPYKEKVIPYLDDIDPLAARAGAVNVIKIIPGKKGKLLDNKRLVGCNSDVAGFTDSIRPLITDDRRKALVLGTGGASKAVCVGLDMLDVKPQLVSRTKRPGMLTYDELTPELMAEYKVIVNTTPLGMYPHMDEAPNIPYEALTPAHLCYDLLYNPDVTLFMRKAAEHGAEVKNGLEMLLLQAFLSWEIWNSNEGAY
jgi:shikimate dehydrogenase